MYAFAPSVRRAARPTHQKYYGEGDLPPQASAAWQQIQAFLRECEEREAERTAMQGELAGLINAYDSALTASGVDPMDAPYYTDNMSDASRSYLGR